MKLLERKRHSRAILSLIRLPFGLMGAIGGIVLYKTYLSGNDPRFAQMIDHGSSANEWLTLLGGVGLVILLLGVTGLISLALTRMGKIKIATPGGEFIIKWLPNVPELNMCESIWKSSEIIASDPEINGYFIEQTKKCEDILTRFNSPISMKKYIAYGAAGASTLSWALKNANPQITEIFGKDGHAKETQEVIADQAWIENAMDNYEKIPAVLWSLIEPMVGEYIFYISGPEPKSPRCVVTTRRVFFVGGKLKKDEIKAINVSDIAAIETCV